MPEIGVKPHRDKPRKLYWGMAVTFNTLEIQSEGAIEFVVLNRPQKLNAIDPMMAGELTDYFSRVGKRSEVRVIVLKGAGRAFCAGVDIKAAFAEPEDRRWGSAGPVRELEIQAANRDYILAMRRCPQPIVAAVQGIACGAGLALALAADLRVVTRDMRMNCAFVRVGLGGCDIGVSYFLPRLVGASVASELILTGCDLNGERAVGLGLANRIVDADDDLHETAHGLASEMLAVSPLGLRLSKEALRFAIDAPSLDAVIAMEDRNQVLCGRSADYHEAVSAIGDRRAPVWADR